MKKAFFLIFLLSLISSAFAQHDGHNLTLAKIAHEASHRIGRLVDTGRLEDVFLKNMSSLEIKSLPHNQHTEPAFSVLASAGTTGSQTLLKFDMNGKYLSNTLIAQSDSEASPWEVNSNEIIEAALHYAMEANPNLNLGSFTTELAKASLGQLALEDGSIKPTVTLSRNNSPKILQIILTPKGEVVSHSVIE